MKRWPHVGAPAFRWTKIGHDLAEGIVRGPPVRSSYILKLGTRAVPPAFPL